MPHIVINRECGIEMESPGTQSYATDIWLSEIALQSLIICDNILSATRGMQNEDNP